MPLSAGAIYSGRLELGQNLGGNLLVYLCKFAVRLGGNDWRAVVGIAADVNMQGNFAQKRNAEFGRGRLCAGMAEDVGPVAAFGTQIIAHIFDNAQYRYINFFEHINAFNRIYQSNVLRCGNDDRSRKIEFLRKGNLDIAGSRRHINHHNVNLSPVNLGQQLLNGTAGFGAAPNQSRILGDEGPDGH